MNSHLTSTVMNWILEGKPCDGDSIEFRAALRALRKQGYIISYDRKTGMYQYTGHKEDTP